MKKCSNILCLLSIISLSFACEKFSIIDESDTASIDSLKLLDSVPSVDTIPTVDTSYVDTCYKCELSDTAELIYNSLLEAYNDSCISCLEKVLIDWENMYTQDIDIVDSLQDLYHVFKEFYMPWDLAKISDSEFGHDIYKGIYFYIIQSDIKYDYNFRTNGDEGIVIKDFHPSISNDTIHLLYLNSDFESAINCFLGSDYAPFGSGSIMSPAFPIDESYNRYYFLHNYLHFFHGHWGNYWHIETHPKVYSISFNELKDSAQVSFRLGYQGGEVILGKGNNNWKIVDHQMTWIE